MKYITAGVVAVLLLGASTVLAQTPPHACVAFPVNYSDNATTVLEVDMHYDAWLTERPGEHILIDGPDPEHLADGFAQIELSEFPTPWSVGDHLMVEITGDGSNYSQSETELFGPFDITPDNPQFLVGPGPSGEFILPVELSSFSAEPGAGQVTLTWVTASEVENAGFNLYRATETNGQYTQVNESLIPGAGNSTDEHTYVYTDENLTGGHYFYNLECVSTSGSNEIIGSLEALPTPTIFALSSSYPNPMTQSTEIAFQLPSETRVSLRIYDMAGREVHTLVNQKMDAGYYTNQWNGLDANGRAVSNGIYFYRMDAGSFNATKKLVVLK